MRKQLLCVLLILASVASYSQGVNEDSLYVQAVHFLNSGQVDSAENILQRLLSMYPTSAKAYNLRGAILTQQGEYDQAIEMFRTSIRADSTYLIAYMNLGNTYNDQGELDSAIAIHRLLITKDSMNADYQNDLGDAYMKKKDIPQAEQAFKKAVQRNPYYTVAHANLGAVYANQKKYKEAIDELFLVRLLDSHYPRVQDDLRHVAMAAESEFEEWVEREPSDSEAHYYYSFYLFYDDDREEAVDQLEEAIRIRGREDRYYFLKALWLWNFKKYDKAIADCQKCLELNPKNWKCLDCIADCYVDKGDISRAIEYFKRAIEIDSLVGQTHFALGEVYGANEEYQKSIDALKRSLNLGHKSPLANYDLAVCYLNLGSYQLALQNVTLARNRNMKYPVKGMDAKIETLLKIIKTKMN